MLLPEPEQGNDRSDEWPERCPVHRKHDDPDWGCVNQCSIVPRVAIEQLAALNHATMDILYPILRATLVALVSLPCGAQSIVVYSNQFLIPLITTENASCQLDFSAQPVNDLWEGTGLGTSSGSFTQLNTVETILVTGPADVYDDPSGTGGDYALGMLRQNFGDKLGLLIDAEGLPFVNMAMDISAINTTCGGPLSLDTAIFLIEVLDAPGGVYNLAAGTVLDADTLVGLPPDPDTFVFNWAHVEGSLDVSAATGGQVAIRFQQLSSNYSSFDNVYIEASQDSVISSLPERGRASIEAFPNPCTDVLMLRGTVLGNATVRVYSLLGAQVGQYALFKGNVDVSNLKAGVYCAQILDGDVLQTLRFVKE